MAKKASKQVHDKMAKLKLAGAETLNAPVETTTTQEGSEWTPTESVIDGGDLQDGCLDGQSWITSEDGGVERQESALGVLDAERKYRVVRDAKTINCLILITRRLGGIQHTLTHMNDALESIARKIDRLGVVEESIATPEVNFKKHVMSLFKPETRKKLTFQFSKDGVIIKPLEYLGRNGWIGVMNIIRNAHGEWRKDVKNVENSHWWLPK